MNKEEQNYNFHFGNKTLFLEFNIPLKSDTIIDAVKEVTEGFPMTEIKIVAYRNILGYWSAYEIETGNSIYCGTTSLKDTKDKINKFLEEN